MLQVVVVRHQGGGEICISGERSDVWGTLEGEARPASVAGGGDVVQAEDGGIGAQFVGKGRDGIPGEGLPKTLRKAGLETKVDILTPLTHGSGVGKFATGVDEATILTAS